MCIFSIDTSKYPSDVLIELKAKQYSATILQEMLKKLESLRQN